MVSVKYSRKISLPCKPEMFPFKKNRPNYDRIPLKTLFTTCLQSINYFFTQAQRLQRHGISENVSCNICIFSSGHTVTRTAGCRRARSRMLLMTQQLEPARASPTWITWSQTKQLYDYLMTNSWQKLTWLWKPPKFIQKSHEIFLLRVRWK